MLLCPACRRRNMHYISYEATVPISPGEVRGYWICRDCGHVIYNFGQRPLVIYGEKRSNTLRKEIEGEILEIRKWMRDNNAPPEIMELFERTRKRSVWMFG